MANTQIVPKLSTVPGKIPTAAQLAPGAISVNHNDRIIYAKHPSTGQVYKLSEPKTDRVWSFDVSANGLTTYLGYLLYSDFPTTGSVYDATAWEITKTTFNAAGESTSEQSATGAWSSRTSLSYS